MKRSWDRVDPYIPLKFQKVIFHVLSNRVNDLSFDRPEAYAEVDSYK
ncbi:unnamed protein product, partial [Brassica rapa subsp. trilocularis]